MSTLLAIGLGYCAAAIGAELSQKGWRIIGTSRGLEGCREIEAKGFEAIAFDGDAPSRALGEAIAGATHILHSVPPSLDGDPLLAQHRADLLSAPALRWIGYLSTIGVYGDHQGAWVDEATPPTPLSARSKARWAAEQAWMALAAERGAALQIFRLAGIYGPGRNTLERLLAGQERRIDKPEQVFNRTHLTDIVATVLAGMARPEISGVFNVTDDEPAAPQDVSAFGAELLGCEPPPLVPWEEADLNPMARSFYLETKRVRNDRIKRDLGLTLTYPTYREGLRALAATLKR